MKEDYAQNLLIIQCVRASDRRIWHDALVDKDFGTILECGKERF
jgi:hypothetical protein